MIDTHDIKSRDHYLNKLIAFRDTEHVKVVTGIRRCGKSSLLKLMVQHLKDTGIEEDQIIEMNFESHEFKKMNADYIYHYVKERFLQAVSEYMADTAERIEGLRSVQRTMSCTDFIDADIEEAEANLELLSGMIRSFVMMNASASLTEQEYQAQYTELTQRYESTKAGYEALLDRRKQMEATAIVFSGILFRLAELPRIPMEFNETLRHTLVDHVTVHNDERIVFTFTDGTEIVTML